jgi:hypothetical protein
MGDDDHAARPRHAHGTAGNRVVTFCATLKVGNRPAWRGLAP